VSVINPISMEEYMIQHSSLAELITLKKMYEAIDNKSTIDRMIDLRLDQEIAARNFV